MRRWFDFAAAAAGLLLLSPLLLFVCLWIKLNDGGPVFYGQWRVGRGGRLFRMWKFRSMRPTAEKEGPPLTVGEDSRITPAGKVLRKTKMDELPQLWNVLRGEMSLVGPRPEVEKYTALYPPELRSVLQLTPGITDPASFAFYDEPALLAKAAEPEAYYVQVLVPEKIRINLEYAGKRTLVSDLVVIGATLLKGLGVKINMFELLKLSPPTVH